MNNKFLNSLASLTKIKYELVKSSDIHKLIPEVSKEKLYNIATELHKQNLIIMDSFGLDFRARLKYE